MTWKRVLKHRLAPLTKRLLIPEVHGRSAYGQEGEDLVAAKLFGIEESPRTGFYVDVGAHHPVRYSNTMYFYDRGWRGINIDAAPGSMDPFRTLRPRDVNLEVPVSDVKATITFEEFNNTALSGIKSDLTAARAAVPGCVVTKTHRLETVTLASVLQEHLPAGTSIDMLSIDVEGHDLQVLRSNDWERFRPLMVLVEDIEAGTLEETRNSEGVQFLQHRGYTAVAKTALTIFLAATECIVRDSVGIRIRRNY